MRRFVVAVALAVVVGLGFAGEASAQIVYGYSRPAGGGVVTGGTYLAPGGYQTFNNYFSPWTGVMAGQAYSTNVFGQAMMRSYGYNPWTGIGYNSRFYQPNYYINPYGVYGYSTVRRWGW